MKKEYESPQLELESFEVEDIMKESSVENNSGYENWDI